MRLASRGVLAARTRHEAQRLPRHAVAIDDGNVPERQDAYKTLATIDDRQAPDLKVSHIEGDFLKLLVVKAVFDVGCHDVPYARLSVLAARDCPRNDVPIGDRANQTVIRADGKKAQILFCHIPGGLFERVIWTDQTHVAAHDVGDPG